MTAKEEILQKIGAANATPTTASRDEWKRSTRSRREILDQFAEYAADYQATVHRIAESELASTVRTLAGGGRVLTPIGTSQAWLQNSPGIVWDDHLSVGELDACEAVLTGCAVAVAETGTIVLDGGVAQGRRAISLIPDHHICVVFAAQVVDTVPESVAALSASVHNGQPLTWISGPSATSDIELSRVEGVHGPRRLDILLVES